METFADGPTELAEDSWDVRTEDFLKKHLR